jgi:hypothetical protein
MRALADGTVQIVIPRLKRGPLRVVLAVPPTRSARSL